LPRSSNYRPANKPRWSPSRSTWARARCCRAPSCPNLPDVWQTVPIRPKRRACAKRSRRDFTARRPMPEVRRHALPRAVSGIFSIGWKSAPFPRNSSVCWLTGWRYQSRRAIRLMVQAVSGDDHLRRRRVGENSARHGAKPFRRRDRLTAEDSGPGEHTRLACRAVRPRAAQGVDCGRPPTGAPAVVPKNRRQ
jgi:hypothetical protein